MATTFTSSGTGNWSDPSKWSGGSGSDYPGSAGSGDTVVIGAHTITLDATAITTLASSTLVSITGNNSASVLAVGATATVTLTDTTNGITCSSSNASAFVQVSAGTLTVVGIVVAASTGNTIRTSSTGALTLNPGTGNTAATSTSSGYAVYHGVGTALQITGNIVAGSGTGSVYVNHASATLTMTGVVSAPSSNFRALVLNNCSTASITAPSGQPAVNGASSSTSGCLSCAAGSLTITGASGQAAVTQTAASGYAVVFSSTGTLTVRGADYASTKADVAINNSDSGRGVSSTAGTVAITGAVNDGGSGYGAVHSGTGQFSVDGTITSSSGGIAVYNNGTHASSSVTNLSNTSTGQALRTGSGSTTAVTGTVSASSGYAIYMAAGTVNLSSMPTTTGTGVGVYASSGTLNWTGTLTLGSAGVYTACRIDATASATINLGTAGTALVVTLHGRLAINDGGATVTPTYATINKQSSHAQVCCLNTDISAAVAYPTIPAAADVKSGVARGYPGDDVGSYGGGGATSKLIQPVIQ